MLKNRYIINFISVTLVICFVFGPISVLADSSDYIWSSVTETINTSASTEETNESNKNSLALESGSAILIEQITGEVLYEHNCHEQLRPASVTKVMTILLIMEAIDEGRITYEDKIPCSETAGAMGGSQIWLDTTEELSVDDMLKAICVVSANEYAHSYHIFSL